MVNLTAFIDRNFERFPDKVVLTMGEHRLTNRQFHEQVNAVAAGLRAAGVQRGDIVAVLLNNRPEFMVATLAANRIGAAFLPLNWRLAPDEWRYILTHSGAVALITETEFLPGLNKITDVVAGLRSRVVLEDSPASAVGAAGDDWTTYAQMVSEHRGVIVAVEPVDGTDLHRLMYTSGTTSRPKGVPISHDNVLWKDFSHIIELGITHEDVTLVAGPLFHAGAFDIPALDTLHAGGSLVIMPRFDEAELARLIHAERPTTTWLATAMIGRLLQLRDFANYDTTSLRLILIGGEKTPQSLVESLQHAFPNAWISDSYGLTETVSAHTFNDAEHAISKIGSVGRSVIHHDLVILDDTGRPLPVREIGEIAVRGPKVFGGYWRDEAATAKAFVNGWFLTGDVGWLDEEGYLYIEDRKKDMIISGGENIASAEIERVLYENPAVLEAAVVAAPSSRWGEVPRAFVVLKPGVSGTEESMRDFCRERLAKFKVPDAVEFVDELPRTPTGKVMKRSLRELGSRESVGERPVDAVAGSNG